MDRKKLKLNTDKTMVMRFRKGGVRKKNWIARWKGVKLEDVKECKYLGFIMHANEQHEAYIRKSIKEATEVMKKLWGIAKKDLKKIRIGELSCLIPWNGWYLAIGLIWQDKRLNAISYEQGRETGRGNSKRN